MATSIRPARVQDAHDVARLTGQLGYDTTPAEAAARLTRIVAKWDQRFLIADADGQAVGWLHAALAEFIEAEPFAVIAGLVVDRDHRRQGIGRLLIEAAELWARERGCSLIRLWSSVARSEAHRFYEHLGYANVKTQHAFAKPLGPVGRQQIRQVIPHVK
jgi:GNAT superfamily N-acetyltransferase